MYQASVIAFPRHGEGWYTVVHNDILASSMLASSSVFVSACCTCAKCAVSLIGRLWLDLAVAPLSPVVCGIVGCIFDETAQGGYCTPGSSSWIVMGPCHVLAVKVAVYTRSLDLLNNHHAVLSCSESMVSCSVQKYGL